MGRRKRIKTSVPYLVERPGHAPAWVATWSDPNGERQRLHFTYGPGAPYASSEPAYEAAKERQHSERAKADTAVSDRLLAIVYEQSESLYDVAKTLGVSYPTAAEWVREAEIEARPQGYNPPALEFTGLQCRLAREYLGYTRDEMSEASKVGKTAIRLFELGKSTPRRSTIKKLENFFNTRNIVFTPDKSTFFDTTKQYFKNK